MALHQLTCLPAPSWCPSAHATQRAWSFSVWARPLPTTGPLHFLATLFTWWFLLTQVSTWMSSPQMDLLGQSVPCSPTSLSSPLLSLLCEMGRVHPPISQGGLPRVGLTGPAAGLAHRPVPARAGTRLAFTGG